MKGIFLFTVIGALALSSTVAFAADAKSGEAVYMRACRTCHGPDGHGNPAIAKALNATFPDFSAKSDAEIKSAVANGKGKMKPVTSVEEKDLPDLIAFVRTLPKN